MSIWYLLTLSRKRIAFCLIWLIYLSAFFFLANNDEGWRSNSDIYFNLIVLFFRFTITPFTWNPALVRQYRRTFPRCLSCTTRRNECASRSHNLWLSWLLLCGLCMIFCVGEFWKHGLREPAKWRISIINIDIAF